MIEEQISRRFKLIEPALDERMRRYIAASEALVIGHGGITIASKATGVSRRAITEGCKEIRNLKDQKIQIKNVRKQGAGRKRNIEKQPLLIQELEKLIYPLKSGDSESPLYWTSKSVRKLSKELKESGFQASYNLVAKLLKEAGYSLQLNQKGLERSILSGGNAQFEYIYKKINQFQNRNLPVIVLDIQSINCAEQPLNKKPGKPSSNGCYVNDPGRVKRDNIDRNRNLSYPAKTDKYTAYTIECVRKYWSFFGKQLYPDAKQLLIIANNNGVNNYRRKQWEVELQQLANEMESSISVCHMLPGTVKWNKIEHKFFFSINLNRKEGAIVNHKIIISLISATKKKIGVTVQCELDENSYPIEINATDGHLSSAVNLLKDKFHGEWNYTILPNAW